MKKLIVSADKQHLPVAYFTLHAGPFCKLHLSPVTVKKHPTALIFRDPQLEGIALCVCDFAHMCDYVWVDAHVFI